VTFVGATHRAHPSLFQPGKLGSRYPFQAQEESPQGFLKVATPIAVVAYKIAKNPELAKFYGFLSALRELGG
jgi:hypothetical protein